MDGAEEEALRSLFAAHQVAVFRYALRLTSGDRGRAEDIVQETMVRAWRNPEAMREDRGPLRPWLFTVAKRLAIDAHRARAARPQEVGEATLAAVPTTEDIDANLDRVIILDALSALSADHRAVIVEMYYGGRSVAQVAERLKIPPGTVKSRAFYGLRTLRVALAERGVT